MQISLRTPRLFRGWYIVFAAFVLTFISFGCLYTFSAFVVPLQHDLGASRGALSLAFSVTGCLSFGLGALSGPLADRFGARPLAVLGMVLFGAGLFACGEAQSPAEVLVAYALGVGLGMGTMLVPAMSSVQRWFERRRALASGIALAGVGVGTLIVPPLVAILIAHVGWRDSFHLLGVLAAVVGALVALLIENDPRSRGLAPDGDVASAATRSEARGVTLREAVRMREFAALYASSFLAGFGVLVPFAHLVPYAIEHGSTPRTAAMLIGALGIGSTAGRVLLGFAANRMTNLTLLALMCGGMAVTLLLWGASSTASMLAIFAIVFGVFYGGWVAVVPPVAVDFFGTRHIGSVMGVLYTSVALGALVGPSAAGWAYDISGSYLLPIAAAVVATAASAAIVVVVLSRGRAPAGDAVPSLEGE